MNTWQNIKAEIDAEVAKTAVEPVQDVTEVFKYRMSKGGAGIPNDNQIFTTWSSAAATSTTWQITATSSMSSPRRKSTPWRCWSR